MKFEYNESEINFSVVKSKRKTICITIKFDGEIIVKCPLRMKDADILSFVKSKAQWIIKKQNEIKNMNVEKVNRTLESGSTLMLLGKEMILQVIHDECLKKTSVELINNKIIVKSRSLDKEEMREALKKWYKAQCLKVVTERIKLYEKYFKLKVKDIKVKEQKRRWASCTYDNRILFNWRCVMADIKAIDYIVVHEMCHFEHKNHSRDFWNSVKEIMPDYEERKEYLKVNSMRMDF